jgi:hypothetical protein
MLGVELGVDFDVVCSCVRAVEMRAADAAMKVFLEELSPTIFI